MQTILLAIVWTQQAYQGWMSQNGILVTIITKKPIKGNKASSQSSENTFGNIQSQVTIIKQQRVLKHQNPPASVLKYVIDPWGPQRYCRRHQQVRWSRRLLDQWRSFLFSRRALGSSHLWLICLSLQRQAFKIQHQILLARHLRCQCLCARLVQWQQLALPLPPTAWNIVYTVP